MTTITYHVGSETGSITWAAAEQFRELEGKEFRLGAMEATKLSEMTGLSFTATLLLSAVAGAVIQHLLDKNFPAERIFQDGVFVVTPAMEQGAAHPSLNAR